MRSPKIPTVLIIGCRVLIDILNCSPILLNMRLYDVLLIKPQLTNQT